MLKQRVITGIVLIILVAAGILLLPNELFAVFALVFMVGLGAWEWAGLTGCYMPNKRMAGTMMILIGSLPLIFLPLPAASVLGISVPIWAALVVAVLIYPKPEGFYKHHRLMMRVLGIFVLVPAWYAVMTLHGMQGLPKPGAWYLLYLISLTAVADTSAYFTGRAFGKHKLAPQLSPGKTWEGFFGAVVFGGLWALVSTYWLDIPSEQFIAFIALSKFTVVMSVFGDLFESLLKREAGVKDSGHILPGHGGILDRIDSLLSAAPLFTLGMLWLFA